MAKKRIAICLIVLCCLFLAGVFLVGLNGNRPGIMLCYLAGGSLILALVHDWRKAKYFLILLGASVVGFVVFAILHNVFYGLAQISSDVVVLSQVLKFLDATSFLVAIFMCPAGLVIGIIGSMVIAVIYFRKKRLSGAIP